MKFEELICVENLSLLPSCFTIMAQGQGHWDGQGLSVGYRFRAQGTLSLALPPGAFKSATFIQERPFGKAPLELW